MRKTGILVALCCSAVVIAGCASPAPTPATVTVQATPASESSTAPRPETPAPITPPASTVVPATPSTTVAAVPTIVTAPAAPAVLMPEVTCMNLQAAQNAIQAAAAFFSRSEDATGAGRNQIVDSNWTVVSQSPPAGTPIGEGDAVLSAVKIGEPGDCS